MATYGYHGLPMGHPVARRYLAAWGTDELSVAVRDNDAAHGPGKHLLHAQASALREPSHPHLRL